MLCDLGVGGEQGIDLEGLPTHSSPLSSACPLGFHIAGLELECLLWPLALTFWNSTPVHTALVKLQDQRFQQSSHVWCLSCLHISTQRPPFSTCTPSATGCSPPPRAACSFHFWAALHVSKLFLIWRWNLSSCCFYPSSLPSLSPSFWSAVWGSGAPPCPNPCLAFGRLWMDLRISSPEHMSVVIWHWEQSVAFVPAA